MRTAAFVVALLALLLRGTVAQSSPGAGPPKIVFVDADSPLEIGDGTSWETAFKHLAIALAAEPGPAEFWVAAGAYNPVSLFGDRRFASIVIEAGQHVFGGFAGTETERDQRRPSVNIVGLSGYIGSPGTAGNSFNVVKFDVASGGAATLDGVVVSGGYDDRPSGDAGGIIVDGGAVTITDVGVSDMPEAPAAAFTYEVASRS